MHQLIPRNETRLNLPVSGKFFMAYPYVYYTLLRRDNYPNLSQTHIIIQRTT